MKYIIKAAIISILIFLSIVIPSSAKDFAVLNGATMLLNASGGTGNVILVPGSGNVSIGASIPAAKLHVGGDALIGNKSAVDSTTWTDVMGSPATIGDVFSLAVYNGQLYAGNGSGDVGNVWRYDGGTTWTDVMGTPATIGEVTTLAVYNGQLYAGDEVGGNTGNVYRYDGGTTWTDVMGSPANISEINSLTVYNGQLYVGDVGVGGDANIYRYDGGTTWTDVMGSPATIGRIYANLAVYNGQLYVGDDDGNIYRYDGGTTWTDVMGSPATINPVYSLAVYNGQLYAGDNAGNIYRYDGGTTWTDVMGSPATVSTVRSLAVYNGQLYAGENGRNVYRYDGGTTWTDVMGTPANISIVRSLAVYNGQLYAGDYGGDVYSYSANPPQSYTLKFRSENETASLWFQGNMSSGQSIEGQNQHGQFIFSHGIQTQSGAYDVAEEFPTYDSLEPGDIIASSIFSQGFIEKSSMPYQNNLLGIVSTKPGMVLASGQTGEKELVSLAGRVPVKVSTENGAIAIGDFISSSSMPGVGMKATQAGRIVGMALEPYNNPAAGRIKVFIDTSWYDPYAIGNSDNECINKGFGSKQTE